MLRSNRGGERLLTAGVLVAALLLSSLVMVQARPPLPEEVGPGSSGCPAEALAPNAPPAPVLVSPPEGAHITGNPDDTTPGRILSQPLGIPCFEWQAVPGATDYRIQVSEVQQDTAIVLDVGFGYSDRLEQTVYCPTAYDMMRHGVQDETTYYWRVVARGGSPITEGPWSDWRSFTRHWASPPALLSPAPDEILVQPPVLSWTPVDGAQFYQLQVSSDDDFPDVGSLDWPAFTWRIEPQNSEYTMGTMKTGLEKNHLPNDPTIYWRVRAVSGGNVTDDYRVGPWSNGGEGQVFNLCWACDMTGIPSVGVDYRPQPLTPARESSHVNSAYFSWSPVQGAAAYDLEINDTSSFVQDPPNVHLLSNGSPFRTANTGLLWEIDDYWQGYSTSLPQVYWRVRAVNYYGVESEWSSEKHNISGVFRPEKSLKYRYVITVPDLLYPNFYYEPILDHEQWEDRTVSVPTFMWDQVPGAISYTLEVASDNLFNDVVWNHPTANLSATPTSTVPFSETGLYYWRVKAHPQGVWGQRWETRVDQSLQIFTPTTAPPRLLYPLHREEGDGYTYGQETLGRFPRLDWFPVSGADHYEVQIATESSFASPLETTETELTSYTPVAHYPPDAYFWRVRALDSGGTPLGSGEGWSSTRHFLVARDFVLTWLYDTGLDAWRDGDFAVADSLLTTDPSGDQAPNGEQFDLTTLYTARDNNFWYFGWDLLTTTFTPTVIFQLYLDVEGADGVGMDTNPDGGALPNASEPYRPEYVLEWDPTNPTEALRYKGQGGVWSLEYLTSLNGEVKFDDTVLQPGAVGYAILAVPHAVIGSPGTINALLVALDAGNDVIDVMDLGYVTVSSSPVPRLLPHNRYDATDTPIYPATPLMTWYSVPGIRNPVLESAIHYGFSGDSQVETGSIPSGGTAIKPMPFSGSNVYYVPHWTYEDNVYYWRVRSRYPNLEREDYDYGWELTAKTYDIETSWSRHTSFSKQTPVPINLTISDANISGTLPYVSKTPLFSWDPLQGAAAYRFELVGAEYHLTVEGSSNNFYIPTQVIPNGEYVWHVHVMDAHGNYNEDAYAEGHFVKGADTPVPSFPIGSDTFTDTVYFQWEPLTGAAYYQLEVAADPYFNSLYDVYDKINNTVYVPGQVPEAIERGNFYWRVCGYNGGDFYNGFLMGCASYYLAPHLTIAKTGPATLAVNDTLLYTISVSSTRAVSTTYIGPVDSLPSGTTFLDASPGYTYLPPVVSWNPLSATIASGQTHVYTVAVQVDACGVLTNTASVTQTGETSATNKLIVSDLVSADVLCPAEWTLSKQVSSMSATISDTLAYTISVRNVGDVTGTYYGPVDTVPAALTFQDATPGYSGPNPLQWNADGLSLSPDEERVYTFTAYVDTCSVIITNTAFITTTGTAALTVSTIASTTVPPCDCVPPPPDIVAWWPLDETTGSTATDIVGGSRGTHVNGPTPVAGMVDGALDFDGVDDYVRVSDAPAFNFGAGDLSIDAWIRTNITDTYQVFVDKRGHDTGIGYAFLLDQGRLAFRLADSYGGLNYYNLSSPNLADGEWHFVAVTLDRDATDGGKLYADGQLIHTFDPTGRLGDITNPADLWISKHHPVPEYPHELWFEGSIDEVELFSRTLTITEVQSIYNAGSAGKCKCVEQDVVLPVGVPDDFSTANGAESPVPSAGLEQHVYDHYSIHVIRDLDDLSANKFFAHTFTGLRPLTETRPICSATLEIRVKPGSEIMRNDIIELSFTDDNAQVLANPWKRYFGSGNSQDGLFDYQWGSGSKPAETLVLDLDALPLASEGTVSILSFLDYLGFFDLTIRDDTGIDYMNLMVHYCCAEPEGPDLAITKTHAGTLAYGQNATYTLAITNVGSIVATGPITVVDRLPAGVTFVSGDSYGWTCLASGQRVTCAHPDPLVPDASTTLALTVAIVPVHQFPGESDTVTNCAWVKTADDVNRRNDVDCDTAVIVAPAGGIAGTVTTPDGTPLADVLVNVCQFDSGLWQPTGFSVTTATGDYVISNLDAGVYRVYFIDLFAAYADEYYDDANDFASATDVTVSAGLTTSGIDAVLDLPAPPPVEIDVQGGVVWNDPSTGESLIIPGSSAEITFQATVTCANEITPTNVVLLASATSGDWSSTYPMTETFPGSGQYTLTLTSADINQWPLDDPLIRLTIQWDCSGEPHIEPVGRVILVDPSGQVTDEITGNPIAGAMVTLYKVPGWRPRTSPEDEAFNTCESHNSKDPDEMWSQPAPTDLGMMVNSQLGAINGTQEISPTINPQATGELGRYGWDVVEGCWYVVVQAFAYETKVSPVVGVPPEVTDLDLALMPKTWPYQVYLPLILK